MARTDKTKPYHALFLEKNAAQESHDHSLGECDLVSIEEWVQILKNTNGHIIDTPKCRWELKTSFIAEHPTCGCALCTGSYEHKLERRRERHNKKYKRKTIAEE